MHFQIDGVANEPPEAPIANCQLGAILLSSNKESRAAAVIVMAAAGAGGQEELELQLELESTEKPHHLF